MRIILNGKAEELEDGKKLTLLLDEKGINPDKIVVEHNFNIIPRTDFEKITLSDGDTLEVLAFMGGGAY